jgi:hypothetical protein
MASDLFFCKIRMQKNSMKIKGTGGEKFVAIQTIKWQVAKQSGV